MPVIHGTFKYPSQMPCSFEYSPEETAEKGMKKFLAKSRNVGVQMSKVIEPSGLVASKGDELSEIKKHGIEVCQKGWQDPNTDVFVLKLGQKHGKTHDVELELRTPKCADICEPSHNSTAVQVFEEEFEDYVKPDHAPIGKKDAKAPKTPKGKKGKGKGKKK